MSNTNNSVYHGAMPESTFSLAGKILVPYVNRPLMDGYRLTNLDSSCILR